MIVCHCRVVNDATVRQAVDSGARTLSEVCRSTGTGQDCGGCVFAVRRLICEHVESRAAEDMEEYNAAS